VTTRFRAYRRRDHSEQPAWDCPRKSFSEIHAALASRNVTCAQLIEAHLRRIDAYDERGPALNALISINSEATETAAAMDQLTDAPDLDARPLHCIPVILKDNFDTADMPTTLSVKQPRFDGRRMRPRPARPNA